MYTIIILCLSHFPQKKVHYITLRRHFFLKSTPYVSTAGVPTVLCNATVSDLIANIGERDKQETISFFRYKYKNTPVTQFILFLFYDNLSNTEQF